MKKSSIIKICSAVIVFAVISVGIILLQSWYESVPRFEFLKSPEPVIKKIERKKEVKGVVSIKYYYTFETDYNDFYTRASQELKKLKLYPGFDYSFVHSFSEEYPDYKPCFEEVEWYYRGWSKQIIVTIYNNYKLSEEGKSIEKQHPCLVYAEGFVTVYVSHTESKNQRKFNLKSILDKLRN